MIRILRLAMVMLVAGGLTRAMAAEQPTVTATVTVGVLKFGTATWELDTLRHNRFDEAAGFTLKLVELASNQATQVALQARAVDMIVSDWLWVARQRAAAERLSFLPHSSAVGEVVVPAGSSIAGVADLRGKRIGIAGSPLDKSWLLLRALARQRYGLDLEREAQPAFAAPPLLNQKLLAGEFDAVLNYWPFAARLEARGTRRLIGVDEILRQLGLGADVPALGYVFRQEWAEANPALPAAFAAASRRAKEVLAASDPAWQRLKPLMQAEDEATWSLLRDRYRAGIPRNWGTAERDAAARLYALLVEVGGTALVGEAKTLPAGTFWSLGE